MIKNVIKCPTCGMEYHPAEIFVPNMFFGKPDIIKRDTEGHIVECTGSDMDTHEVYSCDKCGNHFSVVSAVTFTAEAKNIEPQFEEYVAPPRAKFKVDEF